MDVRAEFLRAIRAAGCFHPDDTLVLGVSGGADSLAMLHLFVSAQADLKLKPHVLHLNHHIRGEQADADAEFVSATCHAWSVACRVVQADVPALARRQRQALEEAARGARYRALAEEANRLDAHVIAVAHNADDQAETVLMHFLRGSGLAGLRGMLPVTPLSDFLPEDSSLAVGEESGVKFLLRPLLAIPRADIEAYCAAQKLTPRVDHTNFDTTYFRNRLRREVLPLLETLTPGLRGRLAHTASVIAADYDQMQRDLEAAWPEISIEETSRRVELDLAKWRAWPLALRRAAIRRAMTHLRAGLRNVGFVHVEDALKVAQTGSTGAQATLPDGLLLRVDYGSLIIGAASDRPPAPDWPLLEPGADIALAAPAQIALASGWRFGLSVYDGPRVGPGWDALLADPWCAALRLPSARMAGLRLRTRRRGDRFQPQGLAGSQKVNEFMINARIPAAWRDQLPMFVVGDQIAWLCGWRVDERFAARLEAKEVWLARFEKT